MDFYLGFILGKLLTFLLFCLLAGAVINRFRKRTPPRTLLESARSRSALISAFVLTLLVTLSSLSNAVRERQDAEFAAFTRACIAKASEQIAPEKAERGCECATALLREHYGSIRALEADLRQGAERAEKLKKAGIARCQQ